MNSPESEVESKIFNGNYTSAVETARKWLVSSSSHQENSTEYDKAKEAYAYAKFFLDRYDRINSTPIGRERAKIFMDYLKRLEELRKDHHFQLLNRLWHSIYRMLHSEIAESLAKDMAGQKSYNLQEEYIFQLSFSLIEIQNFQGAKDALTFLHNMNAKSPLVNLLLAFVCHELNETQQTETFLREALFINPDILKNHVRFIPGGAFKKLWDEIEELGLEIEIKCRNFALLAEINGFYQKKREVNQQELRKIEDDYEKLLKEYEQSPTLKEFIFPRLLHHLSWIIFYLQKYEHYERADHYQRVMLELDSEIYNMYKENNLKKSK